MKWFLRALIGAYFLAPVVALAAAPSQPAKVVAQRVERGILHAAMGTPYIPYHTICHAGASYDTCSTYIVNLRDYTYTCKRFRVDDLLRLSHVVDFTHTGACRRRLPVVA